MRIVYAAALFGLAFVATAHRAALAEVILETHNLRLEIGDDGLLKSLAAKPSGTEYGWLATPGPVASVRRGKQTFPASRVTLAGDKLTVHFAAANATATYDVTRNRDYLALKLSAIEGEPVDDICLLQLSVKRLPYLGDLIDVAYDDDFGICLCGGNIKTDAGMEIRGDNVLMAARASRDVGLLGATAVLFGCEKPKRTFLDVMEIVERDFGMPPGAKNRRSPVQEYSYLWAWDLGPSNVEEHIKVAKRGGFRIIMVSYDSFSTSLGHFAWSARYPGGAADMKKVTDAIRKAGLKVGMHLQYSKAILQDPYVSPVPDDRLLKLREFTLAAPLDAAANTITVKENPSRCTLLGNRRVLQIGKELVAYEDYTITPPFQFKGCQRGHWKTVAGAHAEGDRVSLLGVDATTPVFVRFDQNTDLQDEVARRIAEIVNETGPYDFFYFDGAEDVHEPFWYHVANAQHRLFRLWRHVPPVCESAFCTHFSWHMITRSHGADAMPMDVSPKNEFAEMKAFCRRNQCRDVPGCALNFSRTNFGWIRHLVPDSLEYIWSRAAAWDCPSSLWWGRSLGGLHLDDDCLDTTRIWEEARIGKKLTEGQRNQLKDLNQEHHLFINERGEYELVPIQEVTELANDLMYCFRYPHMVCGNVSLKAYIFQRAGEPRDTYVMLWAIKGLWSDDGPAEMFLPVAPDRLTLMRPFGTSLPLTSRDDGMTIVPVSNRRYLKFSGMGVDQVKQIICQARSVPVYRQ